MKLNWKVRFKNKVWLGSFCSLIIGFLYSMLALFDVFPQVTESIVLQLLNQVLTFLGLIGVIRLAQYSRELSRRCLGHGTPPRP